MLLCLVQAGGPSGLPQAGAYVWQRHWTPALSDAVRENRDLFVAWHVLAAEGSVAGGFARFSPDWAALAGTGRPLVPVIRIDGRLADDLEPAARAVAAIAAGLPASVAIEIDHDSATARLGLYAAFLRRLREKLGRGRQIWITALPDWLGSPEFSRLALAADRVVLQVHAVEDPRLGLFDPLRAERWVRALAASGPTPFLVSIPAYGARVVSGPSGGLLAVAAETTDLDSHPGDEEMAEPSDVAAFLAWLRAENFPAMTGVVWFRLPVRGDLRAWSTRTVRAVSRGEALRPHVSLVAHAEPGGAEELWLASDGNADAPLPEMVTLGSGCDVADGAGSYAFGSGKLIRIRYGMLRAGERVRIGWRRCRVGERHGSD